jgi:SAM-dependent methyltransferase
MIARMNGTRDKINAHYRPAAASYRQFWAPVLRQLARPLLERLSLAGDPASRSEDPGAPPSPPRGGTRCLDLGSGVGTLSADLKALVGTRGHVVAGDLTRAMLLEAQRGCPSAADPVLLDASRLPFPDHVFDLIVCAFVLHHVREQHRALAEVCRVQSRRGEFGIATWAVRDKGNRAFTVFEDALVEAGAPTRDPAPVPVWEDDLKSPGHVERLLRHVGFLEVRSWSERPLYQWTPETLLGYLLGQGGTRRRLEKLSPSRQRTFRDAMARRLAALDTVDLAWRPEINYAIARC